ncbi:MAG TPA: hypothetical protein VFU98_19155, partial [Microlunatus sp.]|nr:hypothetical protein [Microlunatus sp.]
MGKNARYTEQMPFVGTPDQKELVDLLEKHVDSRALVLRAGLNLLAGLEDDQFVPGETVEEVAARVLERMDRPALAAR